MITAITPFKRKENLDLLSKVIKGHANWIVLVDDDSIVFPDWVTVKRFSRPPEGVCKSNWLFNEFLSSTKLDDETRYMILCDDDSVEEGFFDKIPNKDVVITSMKRGDNVLPNPHWKAPVDLIAKPENMKIAFVAGEQCIVKGKILRNFRYGLNAIGDGEMVLKIVNEFPVTYVPDTFVLFNYFEDGRYNSFRRKPIVLFVGDYYCAGHPAMGLSEWEGNIWASLESTGLAEVARFHFDKYYYNTGNRGDSALIERIDAIKPDYVVLIIYKHFGQDQAVLLENTMKVIQMMGVPVITIWGDLEAQKQRDIAKTLEPYCKKMIGTANKAVVESLGYTYLHVPKDPRIFNNPNKTRDIDIVFSGSYGIGRWERQQYLHHLLNNGIKLVVGGSEGGEHFTTEEYADRYKRAKLALSFSKCHGANVVNARPFEAMSCGAMLLEQESPELVKLFVPYIDYIPWKDECDLLDKVKYYLERDDERKAIADNGCRKVQELYSAKIFWTNALNSNAKN